MKAFVTYESKFGNTEAIARAIADGLRADFDVTVADIRTMPAIGDTDLLVVGAPAHAFSTSRPRIRGHMTREEKIKVGTAGIGVRVYLDYAPWLSGTHAAAFDTTMKTHSLPASAARMADRRLRGLGCHMVAAPESFHVVALTGPLVDGEPDRAYRWARSLAGAVLAARGPTLVGPATAGCPGGPSPHEAARA
ncbi:flavodoxin family protein [Actinoplanes philippinensis]|uniref:flavodoxin family protein n=1 Tax=Actinoplanes philippinensis TaxID=35752 RepID=UPI0033E97D65